MVTNEQSADEPLPSAFLRAFEDVDIAGLTTQSKKVLLLLL
jgi:hypothetical protein